MWCEALSSGGVDLPKLASTNRSSQNPSRTVAFYIINHSDSESVNASAGSFHFPVVFGPVFGRSWRIFATNRHFKEDFERTAPWQFEIRNLRVSIVLIAFSMVPDPNRVAVTRAWCLLKSCTLEESQISVFGPFRPSPGTSREFLNPLVLPSRAACQLRD